MKQKKQMNFFLGILPLIVVIVLGIISALKWNTGMYVPLIGSIGVAALISKYIGYSWREIEESLVAGVASALPAVFILIMVGALIGSWMQGGVIPTMIYYSLELISPTYFIPTSFIITSLFSISTGSAFATIATIGLSLMAAGVGMGLPSPILASAVISGAFFGNTVSPLTDVLILSSTITGERMDKIISHIMKIAIPAVLITTGLFYILSLPYVDYFLAESNLIEELTMGLKGSFIISPLLLTIPLIIIILSMINAPAIPSLTISVVLGVSISVFVQRVSIGSSIDALTNGNTSSTGIEIMDRLLNSGGILSMSATILLTTLATALGGILENNGFLDAMVGSMMKSSNKDKSLIIITILSSLIITFATGSQLLAITLPISMFSKEYKRRQIQIKNLIRIVICTGGMGVMLTPWGIPSVYTANVLNIEPLEFIPYLFFPFVTIIITIIYGLTGFTMTKEKILVEDDKVEVDN